MRAVIYHPRLHGHYNHKIINGSDPAILQTMKKRFYIGIVNDDVVAVGHLRPKLNLFTLIKGGNLDVNVLQQHRGNGYSDEFTIALLREAQRIGMKRVLVTAQKSHKWTQSFLHKVHAVKVFSFGSRDYYILKFTNISPLRDITRTLSKKDKKKKRISQNLYR